MKHKKLSDYSIEKGLIDYVNARAKDLGTNGSDMFSRMVKFYMEMNNTDTILEEKRKKFESAKEDYEKAKAAHKERNDRATSHAQSLAIKYYTGVFEGMKKRDYIFYEMVAKTGLSPDECLDILDDVEKGDINRIVENARKMTEDGETGVGRA